MRKLRVLHLIKSLGRGGAEMLLLEGLRCADRQSFEYSYGYFFPWKDALVPELRMYGADVTCFEARSNLRILLSARRLAAHLKMHRIDLVHGHLPLAGVVGRLAGRLARVPVIYSEHNKQEHYAGATRTLNRLSWPYQQRVIAVSADVADSIRTHLHSIVPIQVILNGVDTTRFRPDGVTSARADLGISADAPVIGAVAVFRKQKQLPLWIEAAALVRSRFPAARFLLVGDGPLREEVEALIAAKGLKEAFCLPGLQADVRPYLAAMDVYLMSSAFEGLPVALLEAMSMGCVPVCTAVGGIPEAVTTGETGMLTEPGNARALAEATISLLDDRQRLQIMSAAARRTIELRFSMTRMTRELEAVYREVAAEYPLGH